MANLLVDESVFTSEDAECLQIMGRCGECLVRAALEPERLGLTIEEAGSIKWTRCAQCRCGQVD